MVRRECPARCCNGERGGRLELKERAQGLVIDYGDHGYGPGVVVIESYACAPGGRRIVLMGVPFAECVCVVARRREVLMGRVPLREVVVGQGGQRREQECRQPHEKQHSVCGDSSRPELPQTPNDARYQRVTPSAPATVSMSLSPRPLRPTSMAWSFDSFGASAETW